MRRINLPRQCADRSRTDHTPASARGRPCHWIDQARRPLDQAHLTRPPGWSARRTLRSQTDRTNYDTGTHDVGLSGGTATLDGALILNGWAPWSSRRFLGYEFVLQLGRGARLEPGFGLATSSASVWFMVGFARLLSHVDKRKRAQSSNLPVS